MNIVAQPLSHRPFRIEDTFVNEDSFTLTSHQMAASTTLTKRWRERPLDPLKFVDDFMGIEKINTELGYAMLSTRKPSLILHAAKCEEFFAKVKAKAEGLGMRVNDAKTQLLCISGSQQNVVNAYIRQDTLKQLGFTFGRRPNLEAYLTEVAAKFRRRIWMLRKLKKANDPKCDLVVLY